MRAAGGPALAFANHPRTTGLPSRAAPGRRALHEPFTPARRRAQQRTGRAAARPDTRRSAVKRFPGARSSLTARRQGTRPGRKARSSVDEHDDAAGPGAPSPRASEVVRALRSVLASSAFATSRRSREFLGYVVTEQLAGRGDTLSERTVGRRALGRDALFTGRQDSSVRVRASRVRTALDAYYAGAGALDPVQIRLPRGTYAPTFHLADRGGRHDAATPRPRAGRRALRRRGGRPRPPHRHHGRGGAGAPAADLRRPGGLRAGHHHPRRPSQDRPGVRRTVRAAGVGDRPRRDDPPERPARGRLERVDGVGDLQHRSGGDRLCPGGPVGHRAGGPAR